MKSLEKIEAEIRTATLAAEARVLAAVKQETDEVQLDTFLSAYLNLATRCGLIKEAGEQLLQIGAAIVWADASEPQSCSSLIH